MLAWAATVAFFSTDSFSGEHTRGVLMPLLESLFSRAPAWVPEFAHAALRKLAHVTEYAILALLVARALARPARALDVVLAAALAFCAFHAMLDEWHQSFVPSRVASVADVLLDAFGAALGLALVAACAPVGRAPRAGS